MNETGFVKFLKQMGKQDHVVDELVQEVVRFEAYLKALGISIESANEEHIRGYADALEERHPGKGRKMVRGIALYFRYGGQGELAHFAHTIREQETAKTRKIFPLREFRGVDPQVTGCLEAVGIANVEEMLAAAKTPALRDELADKTGVSRQVILELVKLSDLSRLGAVKSVRARLYYDAGVDTPKKMAEWEPNALVKYLREFVERTGFDGIAPLPKEIRNGIEKARTLEQIVDYGADE